MMPAAQDVNRRQVFITEWYKTIFLFCVSLRFDSALAYYKFIHFIFFYAAAAALNIVFLVGLPAKVDWLLINRKSD